MGKKEESNKIGRDVWDKWAQQWKTPEFKKKSEIQKKNRKGGDGQPSTHTCGSCSHRTHAADLAKELKRKPHPREVFKHTHFKAGKWVDEKSKLTHEAIEDLLKQNSQKVDGSAESQIVDEVGAYFDAVGGRNKKYRVYGIGSSQNIFYGLGKSYNNGVSETSQFHDDDCQMMQAKLHDMEDQMKVMQERQKYHLKAIQEQQQEQLKAIQEEHKERLTTLENRIADMVKSTRLFNLA
ncbi:uncharacterized protein LOC141661404 [Apium graveolens]|uniref:uncharacterized protein LOC141661404 n=1 Tax=Apium graveolens TaxID=4045 RepID=UPI003D7BF909